MKHLFFFSALFFLSLSGFAQTVQIDTAVVPETKKPNPEVYTYAEVMPSFPGAAGSFQLYLSSNIKYPKDEQLKGIQGTVYVSFVVEKDGSISNVKIVKGVPDAPGFSAEAIRVISTMPRWNPGMMNGKPVRIEMTQPIRFWIPKQGDK